MVICCGAAWQRVITGLVVWLVPLGWEWQGVMFAILTLLAAWLWWKWLSRRVREQKHSDSHLNQRGQQLIGRRFVLESPLVNGRGHMRVGDSSWPVSASEDLGAGTHVEVIAIEGITPTYPSRLVLITLPDDDSSRRDFR
ncbi:nodulation efficiency family protein [Escherichia coli]|uniref:Inner membrane protein YbbJ n=1 Tax=Escherichia coli TaxID=562 RepID=A0A376L0C9_ECOLX|nr:nodulation efficiency family protein [Escherichia coli]